jgi:hypothetical protein
VPAGKIPAGFFVVFNFPAQKKPSYPDGFVFEILKA